MLSDAEMFEWGEKQRGLVSHLTDAELAAILLGDVMGSVSAAESEHAVSDADTQRYNRERGALREAAYRLAKLRSYERE